MRPARHRSTARRKRPWPLKQPLKDPLRPSCSKSRSCLALEMVSFWHEAVDMLGLGPRTRKIPWQLHDGFWTPPGQCTPCQRSGRQPRGAWPLGLRGRHSHPVIPALVTRCDKMSACLGLRPMVGAAGHSCHPCDTRVRRLAASASRMRSQASRVNMKPRPAQAVAHEAHEPTWEVGGAVQAARVVGCALRNLKSSSRATGRLQAPTLKPKSFQALMHQRLESLGFKTNA